MAKPDPSLLDPARYPFVHRVTTRFSDVDPNQHLNNVAIAALFEDGRVRFGQAAGNRKAMVASVAIEYLGQAYFPQDVTAYVGLESIGRSSWTTVQLLEQEGRVFAFCRTTAVRTVDGRPSPIEDDLRAGFEKMLLRDA
jgi:acyl-CoA thioester hydrolase